MADLFGPPPLDQWPAELLVLFHERWNIRQFDGGQPEVSARRDATAEVWEGWYGNSTNQKSKGQ